MMACHIIKEKNAFGEKSSMMAVLMASASPTTLAADTVHSLFHPFLDSAPKLVYSYPRKEWTRPVPTLTFFARQCMHLYTGSAFFNKFHELSHPHTQKYLMTACCTSMVQTTKCAAILYIWGSSNYALCKCQGCSFHHHSCHNFLKTHLYKQNNVSTTPILCNM